MADGGMSWPYWAVVALTWLAIGWTVASLYRAHWALARLIDTGDETVGALVGMLRRVAESENHQVGGQQAVMIDLNVWAALGAMARIQPPER